MSTSFRASRRRRAVVALAALLTTTSALTLGCADQGSAQQSQDAPVLIQQSQTFITVQNNAGLPLVDVRVAVVPYSRTEFSKFLTRIEGGERRDVMLSELASRDGTTFSPRIVNAKSIRVTAKDVVGKEYTVEVPWN